MTQRANQQKIQVSISADEAKKLFAQYGDYLVADDGTKQAAIEIAISKEKGGIEGAKKFLGDTLAQERAQRNIENRKQQVIPVVNAVKHQFQDNLAEQIFRVASQGYIGLEPNVEVNGTYTRDVIRQALDDWQNFLGDGQLHENITNVHFFEPSNKEDAGKSNVGNTLGTRKWQANVISTWFGRTINVHINCSDCS